MSRINQVLSLQNKEYDCLDIFKLLPPVGLILTEDIESAIIRHETKLKYDKGVIWAKLIPVRIML